jgi:hypothetical protein
MTGGACPISHHFCTLHHFSLDPPPLFLYKLTGRSDKNKRAGGESQGELAKAGVKFLNEAEANGSETVCSGV